MKAHFECIVLDCADPPALAEFYRSVLGGEVDRPDERWSLADGGATLHLDTGFALLFQPVEDYRPPQWPDPAHPQQMHLDFAVPDLDEAEAEVLANGATLLDDQIGWRVYADPAGHPFCLVRDWWSAKRDDDGA
ncbi:MULTISPECIES: VOC family protein [Glycomyces]|uniref:Catechol 2,3-dioxygenase-like lactoylglutathione lyase family enzyme n=2 Tax=Glycomyces TaxID=58113 RepID=A0A9X3SY79_9ACTN|nr:VOC family protein [Glycomyces lechevalierae]MDA1385951.1 VOC family protein [Glycomyces lechevalierae]MDR7340892.1 catechol 2,3-dioxygenase-like lactoylglutathione lyase family enzyme [Glycomyces lechevalierae]